MSILTNKSTVDKRTLGIQVQVYKIEKKVIIEKKYIGTYSSIQQAGKVANITGEGVHYVLKHTKKGIEKYTLSGYTFIVN